MSLVNHLKLDETSGNFADSVGSLVGVRDPAGWVSSVPGFLEPGDRCPIFSLGGSYASRILCGDTIWEGSGDQSITCWFRFFDLASTSYFFNKPSSFSLYFLDADNVRIVVLGTPSISENILINSTPLETAGWHHVAVIKRGSVYEVWIDAVLVASKLGPASLISNTENFAIGNHGGGSAITYGNGVYTGVNDFKVWDHALFESELAALAWGEGFSLPYLDNQNPAPGQSNVGIGTNIAFTIADDRNNVEFTETTVELDGGTPVIMYDGSGAATPNDGIQAGFTGSVVSDGSGGYNFDLNPDSDLVADTSYDVNVDSKNNVGGVLSDSYSFDTNLLHEAECEMIGTSRMRTLEAVAQLTSYQDPLGG